MRGFGIGLFLLLAAAAPPGTPPETPEPLRAPGSWTLQTSGTTNALNGVSFVNSTEGFAVGAGGIIRRTTDGGATAWTAQTTPVTSDLYGVAMVTPDVGSAVGDAGKILQTVNGLSGSPSTWSVVTSGNLLAVGGIDDMHAFAAGAVGLLRKTVDGTNWGFDAAGAVVNIRGLSFLTPATEGYWCGEAGTVMKWDGTNWLPVTGSLSTTEILNGISFVPTGAAGTATGWVVGNTGVLRKTNNSGNTWTTPAISVTDSLNGVFAGDNTHAWAVGENSAILATSNGNTWTTQMAPTPGLSFNAVALFGPGTWRGVAVGGGGNVIFTTNSGTLWSAGSSTVTTTLRGAAMLTTTRAIAVGDAGVLLKSTDGGSTWTRVSATLTPENLTAVKFVSATTGWAAGSNGTILKSIDGGDSWTIEVGGTTANLKGVAFGSGATATVGYAVGASGAMLRTRNNGAQWVPLFKPTGGNWITANLASVAAGSDQLAVAVGAGGALLATKDGGVTWQDLSLGAPLSQDMASVSSIGANLYIASGGGASASIAYDPVATSWSAAVLPVPPASMNGVVFPPYSRLGYGVAAGGAIYATRDAGSTWTSETSVTTQPLRAASFPYQGVGWAVGDMGTIVKRSTPPAPLLSFPHYIGTPYTWQPPQIDGFLDPELGENRRPDTGWNQSLQVTYADGTANPPFSFRGLRNAGGKCLYMSFEARADTGWDANDTLVILLRGDTGTADYAANDRRILINPVPSGGFTGTSHIAEGWAMPTYASSENNDPAAITLYKRDVASGGWTVIGPAPTAIVCKVRSYNPGGTNYCWSVELQIPTDASTFSDWTTINTDFKLSFYALRVQTGGVLEFSWPRDQAIAGDVDIVNAKSPAFDWGTAKQGTADDGVGVRIKPVSYDNIGVTTPSTPPGTLETQIHGTLENTFHARVINNATTPAEKVQATFRIADWGVQGGDPSSGAWHLVPANQSTVNPTPVPAQDIPAISGATPGEFDFTCKWQMMGTEPAQYVGHEHQCILVTLDSVKDVNFTERSSWNNMDFVPASTFGRKAYVSSKGYGTDGARNGAQRFYLHTTTERFDYVPGKTPLETVAPPTAKRDGQSENQKADHPYYSGENLMRVRLKQAYRGLASETTPVSHYTWVIHAVKETSQTVKIKGTVYPLLEMANGFGYVARHGSAVDQWTSGLSGAIVTKLNDTEYRVDVPVNGSAAMDSGLEAKEGGSGGLIGLILLIFLFLLIIFWFLRKNP